MKKGKIFGLWILSIFFMLSALVYFPSFSSLTSILIVAIVIPVLKWQSIMSKYIKGKLKIIIVVILALITIFTAPSAEVNKPDDTTVAITTEVSTDFTVESTSEATEPTTESATEPTAVPTTEPAAIPTAEPTAIPTTEPAAIPITEPPHTHIFSAATCTTPKTCSCGETEGDKADHSWTAATCTAPQKCRTCSAENGSAIGHSYNKGTCTVCGSKDPNYIDITYVLNTKSMKFHKPSCNRLPTDNRKDTTMSRDEVIGAGYNPCGVCHP